VIVISIIVEDDPEDDKSPLKESQLLLLQAQRCLDKAEEIISQYLDKTRH
jgi:hypothetical protein